ncbi:MAG: choice-of-anchor D domain-containing protein, partial [Deltaproteobacteria bacterium]|nr:choice-of-anchor D domain-containing protein [Deltaproteobacteria bacterium]
DFGTQGSAMFEQQLLYTTSYGTGSNFGVMYSITGDPSNTLVFGPPCDNAQSCGVGPIATNTTAQLPIKCSPKTLFSTTVSAVVTASYFGGSGATSYGSASLMCTTPAGGGMLSFNPDPVVILGPPNQQATPVAVMINRFGSGSAVLTDATMMGDPSLGIVQCGGASCTGLNLPFPATLDVYCTPSTGTAGSLTVTDSASETATVTVDCNPQMGSGMSPFMTVNPTSMTFPATAVGGSTNGSGQIGNAGNASLDNIQIAVGGIDANDFTVSPCQTGSPCTVGVGSPPQDITVTFSPQGIGPRSAFLTVTSSDTVNSPATITLNGSGTGAILDLLDPANNVLDFGTIPRGQAFPKTITIGDSGNAPLTVTINGVSAPYMANPTSEPVPAMGSNTMQIVCQSNTASQNNDQTFTLTAPQAISGSPQTLTVHCAIADTLVQVMPTQLDFGEHRVGTPEATLDVTVTNPPSSVAPAQIHHIQLATSKTGLSLAPTDTTTALSPGQTATVTLHLATAAETDLAGETLDIDVDGAMLHIPVTGKVVTASSRVAPAELDLGQACVGSMVTGSVSLINTGTATLHLADAPMVDQSFVASFVSPTSYPSSLAPGASAMTTISPAMSATGTVMGTLEWKDDVPSDYKIPVTLDYVASGTAISPAALDFGTLPVDSPGSKQQITIQNCDPVPGSVKLRSLRSTQGPIGAWSLSPNIGASTQLGARGAETVTVTFLPPGRGRYQAELTLETPDGLQKIRLIGEATGKDLDDTSVYACSCSGGSPGAGWPIGLALVLIVRRRRGSSSPR